MVRANSDVSLYTSMRRRSLMTPGIATRPPEPPSVVNKAKARRSLPSTPARRDSLESLGNYPLPIPPQITDPASIARVVTPCEEDYQHTGAFKHGTLRIINGSPVRTPLTSHGQTSDDGDPPKRIRTEEDGDYFQLAKTSPYPNTRFQMPRPSINQTKVQEKIHQMDLTTSSHLRAFSTVSASKHDVGIPMPQKKPKCTPDIHNGLSTLTFTEIDVPELRTTSKHAVMEDDPLEVEHQEIPNSEVLDVRIDRSAKAASLLPRLVSEGGKSKDVNRSDSGIGASPTSQHSRESLAKADSGYSSNVSLRSLSAGLSARETNRAQDDKSLKASSTAAGTPQPARTTSMFNTAKGRSSSTKATGFDEAHTTGAPRPQASRHSSYGLRQSLRLLGQKNLVARTTALIPPVTNSQDSGCQNVNIPELPQLKPSSPTKPSALSIGSNSRKLGKLQRLLSGGRQPLTTHTTHPAENFDVPPIPQEISAKLTKHSGVTQISTTVSPPAHGDGAFADLSGSPSKSPTPDPKDWRDQNRPTQQPISMTAFEGVTERALDTGYRSKTPQSGRRDLKKPSSNVSDLITVNGEYLLLSSHGLKSRSMSALTEEKAAYRSQVHREVTSRSNADTYNSPQLPDRYDVAQTTPYAKQTRSPPPVSMRTRKPQPLRSIQSEQRRSAPAGGSREMAGPTFSRQQSCENIQSYPAASRSRREETQASYRQASRENMYRRPSAEQSYVTCEQHYTTPPPIPPLNPRRSMSSVQDVDGCGRLVRRMVMNAESRHPSPGPLSQPLPVANGQWPNQHHTEAYRLSTPPYSTNREGKRRSSEARQFIMPADGSYAALRSTSTQVYAAEPWTSHPRPQQWKQNSQDTPYTAPGHLRSSSVDACEQLSYQAPYRVLHSYDSPAYRNVPIWD
jgi:hypothetical protein